MIFYFINLCGLFFERVKLLFCKLKFKILDRFDFVFVFFRKYGFINVYIVKFVFWDIRWFNCKLFEKIFLFKFEFFYFIGVFRDCFFDIICGFFIILS